MMLLHRLALALPVPAFLPQDAAPPGGDPTAVPPGGGLMDFLPVLVGILLIFYFLAWRPQAKERRKREAMLKALKVGDKVLTTSGMYGTVSSVKNNDVVLKVDDKGGGVRLRFTMQAVQAVLGDGEAEPETR